VSSGENIREVQRKIASERGPLRKPYIVVAGADITAAAVIFRAIAARSIATISWHAEFKPALLFVAQLLEQTRRSDEQRIGFEVQ
jgi:uncharacterized membrane protein YjdF